MLGNPEQIHEHLCGVLRVELRPHREDLPPAQGDPESDRSRIIGRQEPLLAIGGVTE